jgi:hypothetical protein
MIRIVKDKKGIKWPAFKKKWAAKVLLSKKEQVEKYLRNEYKRLKNEGVI